MSNSSFDGNGALSGTPTAESPQVNYPVTLTDSGDFAGRLSAPMINFAKAHRADKTHRNLGTGMYYEAIGKATADTTDDQYIALVYDSTATGDEAWVSQSVLEPSEKYVLYGMVDSGSVVETLQTFDTDAIAAIGSFVDAGHGNMVDFTLGNGYISITVNPDEYYIFPLQLDMASSVKLNILYFLQNNYEITAYNFKPPITTPERFGLLWSGEDFLHFISNRGGNLKVNRLRGTYCLFQSSSWALTTKNFSQSYSTSTGFLIYVHYSAFIW